MKKNKVADRIMVLIITIIFLVLIGVSIYMNLVTRKNDEVQNSINSITIATHRSYVGDDE